MKEDLGCIRPPGTVDVKCLDVFPPLLKSLSFFFVFYMLTSKHCRPSPGAGSLDRRPFTVMVPTSPSGRCSRGREKAALPSSKRQKPSQLSLPEQDATAPAWGEGLSVSTKRQNPQSQNMESQMGEKWWGGGRPPHPRGLWKGQSPGPGGGDPTDCNDPTWGGRRDGARDPNARGPPNIQVFFEGREGSQLTVLKTLTRRTSGRKPGAWQPGGARRGRSTGNADQGSLYCIVFPTRGPGSPRAWRVTGHLTWALGGGRRGAAIPGRPVGGRGSFPEGGQSRHAALEVGFGQDPAALALGRGRSPQLPCRPERRGWVRTWPRSD